MPRMSPAPESRSAWLAEHLKELMESPHVHLTEGGAEMAPGPVDMFSTRFDAMFMPDAQRRRMMWRKPPGVLQSEQFAVNSSAAHLLQRL